MLIGLVVVGIGTKIVFFSGNKWSALLDISYVSKNENYPIDLVYLWCEDNPQRQKLRNEWKKKLGIMTNANTNSLQATNKGRFVSNDELKYSLRSVEKYAPWINRIYIVTDNQIPKWLNLKHPKIKIVDHKEIMPESARPSFNASAIETSLANIPNLSEHFLFSNDDTMFGDKVEPGDFFKDGKPIYILGVRLPFEIDTGDNYGFILKNGYDLVETKFAGKRKLRRKPHHNIDPYTKTNILKVNSEFRDEINQTMHSKFRDNRNIQRIIYAYYAILTGNGYYKVQTGERLYNLKSKLFGKFKPVSLYVSIHDIERLPKKLEKNNYKLFCTNDNEFTTDCDRANYRRVMEQIFPYKSAFEK